MAPMACTCCFPNTIFDPANAQRGITLDIGTDTLGGINWDTHSDTHGGINWDTHAHTRMDGLMDAFSLVLRDRGFAQVGLSAVQS